MVSLPGRQPIGHGTVTGGGELHGEGAAFARGTLHRHPSAVRNDDPLDQAQPEPGTLHLRGDDISRAIEGLEDARLIGGLDPDAAVGDGDTDVVTRSAARSRGSIRPRRRT